MNFLEYLGEASNLLFFYQFQVQWHQKAFLINNTTLLTESGKKGRKERRGEVEEKGRGINRGWAGDKIGEGGYSGPSNNYYSPQLQYSLNWGARNVRPHLGHHSPCVIPSLPTSYLPWWRQRRGQGLPNVLLHLKNPNKRKNTAKL